MRGQFVSEFDGTHSSRAGGASHAAAASSRIPLPSLKFDRPLGVCCDRRGNIIVCDSGNARVSMFCPDGRFICDLLTLADDSLARRGIKRRTPRPVAVRVSDSGRLLGVAVDRPTLSSSGDHQDDSVGGSCGSEYGSFNKISFYTISPTI